MDNNAVVAILGTILGVGGTGGVGLIVNAYRSHKRGKIEDDGTLIERLNHENRELSRKLENSQKFEQLWMTQAFRYRRQIARTPDLEPNDLTQLWDTGSPRVGSSSVEE